MSHINFMVRELTHCNSKYVLTYNMMTPFCPECGEEMDQEGPFSHIADTTPKIGRVYGRE